VRTNYDEIFENNRRWVADHSVAYFQDLARDQQPGYLYIGCSDSRVPANEITGLHPGELFVHRNIANVLPSVDLNSEAVIEYAVGHLEVEHVIVCGHYGCGGVKAAMQPTDLGLLNPWLENIRDVYRVHRVELDAIADEQARFDRLVEVNVIEQCINVVKSAAVQLSYLRKGFPSVHGWVYDLHTGRLKDLEVDVPALIEDIRKVYRLDPMA
jgi:carbonic anhydrase